MQLRNGYTSIPRGGSHQWVQGPAGALLRDEFFGVAPSGGTTFFQPVGATLTPTTLVRMAAVRAVSGVVTGATVVRRDISRAVAASMTMMATGVKQGRRTLTASLTVSTTLREQIARTLTASVLQAATVQRQARTTESAALTASTIVAERTGKLLSAAHTPAAALARTNIVALTPDGVASNAGWSAVGAATLNQALLTGDSDYIQSSSAGSVVDITFSNPATGLTLTDGQLTLRIRLG